jgi:hypothetical protein
MLPERHLVIRDTCSNLWGSSKIRKNTSSAVAGKSKVSAIIRNRTFQEITGISYLKNPDLKPNGMTIEEKIRRSVIVQSQSLLLGRVKMELMRRDFIKLVKLFSEEIMTFRGWTYRTDELIGLRSVTES